MSIARRVVLAIGVLAICVAIEVVVQAIVTTEVLSVWAGRPGPAFVEGLIDRGHSSVYLAETAACVRVWQSLLRFEASINMGTPLKDVPIRITELSTVSKVDNHCLHSRYHRQSHRRSHHRR